MKPAATLATFADFRIVKTRKLAQFVFEVAIEDADKALAALGGLPRSDGERWCGIALVTKDSAAPSADAAHDIASSDASAEVVTADAPKLKRHFSELPRSAQAAMLGENPVFQRWLLGSRTYEFAVKNEKRGNGPVSDIVADHVRAICEVDTRARLDVEVGGAGAKWDALHARYLSETNQMAREFPPR